MRRARGGMILVAAIAMVSLVAILAVATLSLSGRLLRGSSLSGRAARLDAAASVALGSVVEVWREQSAGRLASGSTLSFELAIAGVGESAAVSITRISTEFFWVVAESRSPDGSARRENLVLRVFVPNADSLLADDSANVLTLGSLIVDSIARTADTALAPASVWTAADGLVHATGDLVLAGGSATGILIVEGDLRITAPLDYSGVIIVRGRVVVGSPGVRMLGLLRVGSDPPIDGVVAVSRSATAIQDVLSQSLTPRPVAGRRWAELY